MPTPKGVFWHKPEVQESISRLAACNDLTLVTGAGASAEVGFPLWGQLVRRLLDAAADADPRLNNDDKTRAAFTARILAEGPIAAASYAQALLGDRLDNVLADNLYRGVAAPKLPGATAIAVASLYRVLGAGSELVTTNYDDQLLVALEQLGVRDGKQVRSSRKRRTGESLVRHLHGQVPRKGAPENVVLTEADYYSTEKRAAWQEKFMASRLSATSALFVGSSLSDPNLLRYLHTQATPSPLSHVAVFTVPLADPVSGSAAYSDAATRKWREVGVDPIQNDMYGQTAQYLHEVRLASALGDSYQPYVDRLASWDSAMQGWLHDIDPVNFAANQDLVQTELAAAAETVRQLVLEKGARLAATERLSAQLWSRRFSTRDLVLLGSSTFRWSNADVMPAASISSASAHPVVQAFSSGSRMLFDMPDTDGPWRSLLALPIALDQHDRFGRLPVGVLTLASTEPLSESVLKKLRSEVPDADEYLGGSGGVAQGLLDPEAALSGT